MKNARQLAILEIISHKNIETQEQLSEELNKIGMPVTQATVSRDIRELRLTKIQLSPGCYKYAAPEKAMPGITDRMVRMFADSVVSVSHSGNMIVIKTLSGSANVAAEAIDSMQWPEILGTLAGDNTIFLVVRSEDEVGELLNRMQALVTQS